MKAGTTLQTVGRCEMDYVLESSARTITCSVVECAEAKAGRVVSNHGRNTVIFRPRWGVVLIAGEDDEIEVIAELLVEPLCQSRNLCAERGKLRRSQ